MNKCWYQQKSKIVSRRLHIFRIVFRLGITVPSFIALGYVWQILGTGELLGPHPWTAPKRPIWIGLKLTVQIQFAFETCDSKLAGMMNWFCSVILSLHSEMHTNCLIKWVSFLFLHFFLNTYIEKHVFTGLFSVRKVIWFTSYGVSLFCWLFCWVFNKWQTTQYTYNIVSTSTRRLKDFSDVAKNVL